jgi:competence ComEA-like helix-hairpin-helix protein
MMPWLTPGEEKVVALLIGGLLLGSVILIYKRSHPAFAPDLVGVRQGRGAAGSIRPAETSNEVEEGECVDINEASEEQLEKLPGIGPVIASRIIVYRDEVGPFSSPDDLLRIRGIGPETLGRIRPHVRCGAREGIE